MPAALSLDVDRSTLRLSEAARHVVVPEGIVDSLWLSIDGGPGVEERVRDFGVEFDTWQDGLAQVCLGIRETGYFASTVGGIVLSIPRQVAKTFFTMCLVLALCTLFPSLTVLWTAHRTRTSTQTFQKMQGFCKRKAVRKYLLPARNDGIRATNGEQEIRFRNGSVIMFGAREAGFGRGFDEVDIEVFDEAQILSEKALEDMVAATNQSRWKYGALLFFMGTPPRPVDIQKGEEFGNRRRAALKVKPGDQVFAESGDMVYVECSADPDVGTTGGPDLDDREQVAKANPSYPHRTPDVSIQRLRANLTSDDSWRREGLGVWDEDQVDPFATAWPKRVAALPAGLLPSVLAVASSIDQAHSSITAAAVLGDVVHVRSLQYGPGVGWVVEAAAEWSQRLQVPVVIDGRGPASSLIPALELAGVELVIFTTDDVCNASAMIAQLVSEERLHHRSDPELDRAVRDAVKRPVGDRWAWGRRKSAGDISPLEGVTLAVWEALHSESGPAVFIAKRERPVLVAGSAAGEYAAEHYPGAKVWPEAKPHERDRYRNQHDARVVVAVRSADEYTPSKYGSEELVIVGGGD